MEDIELEEREMIKTLHRIKEQDPDTYRQLIPFIHGIIDSRTEPAAAIIQFPRAQDSKE